MIKQIVRKNGICSTGSYSPAPDVASMNKNSSFVPPPFATDDLIRRILVDRVDERRLSPGMVVGITEAKSHFVVCFGCRDARTGSPVSEKTIFEIGSITKLFTALLLSDMANRGGAYWALAWVISGRNYCRVELLFSSTKPQRNRNELGETSVKKTWRKHLPR